MKVKAETELAGIFTNWFTRAEFEDVETRGSIVAYLLKARTMEREKQPLLANGSETTFVSTQRLDKHVPTATDTHASIEVLLESALCTRSVERKTTESVL
jgi:hypothetical protein